ncbi:MAG: hypothetical protein II001_04185 [Bacteroidales bacterium]|nr:hypothetical protein [Bacteroidales bacterium]
MKNYEHDPVKYADHHSRLHKIWSGMKYRCRHNKQYLGRGIVVCDEWQLYEPFRDWAKANGYRDDLTIERIDVDGNYCPENCTWIPFEEQARNRTTTRWVEYNGEKMSLSKAAELSGMPYKLVHGRIKNGWDLERALTTPVFTSGEVCRRCKEANVSYHLVISRLRMGWSLDEAISTPSLGIGANQTSYNHGANKPF